ncbi:hypothetical protein O9992_22535 [Vibrio lentus]|nr:hypothetical protein [Vibrio lentus]
MMLISAKLKISFTTIDPNLVAQSGIRIPGVWSAWEAGVRAILGPTSFRNGGDWSAQPIGERASW